MKNTPTRQKYFWVVAVLNVEITFFNLTRLFLNCKPKKNRSRKLFSLKCDLLYCSNILWQAMEIQKTNFCQNEIFLSLEKILCLGLILLWMKIFERILLRGGFDTTKILSLQNFKIWSCVAKNILWLLWEMHFVAQVTHLGGS